MGSSALVSNARLTFDILVFSCISGVLPVDVVGRAVVVVAAAIVVVGTRATMV